MAYEVRLSRQAEAALRRLDPNLHDRILRRLRDLADDPYGPSTKRLTNAGGLRSARVGDRRIIYDVDEANQVVNVSAIGPRGSIYRDI